MKYLIPLILLMISAIHISAQDSLVALTLFEQFSNKPGTLMRTEIKEIGSINFTNISRVKSTQVISGLNASAIKLYNFRENQQTIESNVVYIEPGDLDSIISVLRYFSGEAAKLKPVRHFYYSYVTQNDIEVSFSFFSGLGTISIGRVYHYLRSKVPHATYSFNKKRLSELIELFDQAKLAKM